MNKAVKAVTEMCSITAAAKVLAAVISTESATFPLIHNEIISM